MITGETENMIEDHLAEDGYDDFVRRGRRKLSRAQRDALRARRRRLRMLKRKQRINRRIVRRSTPKRVNRRVRNKRIVSKIKRITSPKVVYPKVRKVSSVRTPSYMPTVYKGGVTPARSFVSQETNQTGEKAPTTKKQPIALYVIAGITVVGVLGAIALRSRKPQY